MKNRTFFDSLTAPLHYIATITLIILCATMFASCSEKVDTSAIAESAPTLLGTDHANEETRVWRLTALLEKTSPISISEGNYITLFEYDSYGDLTSFAHGCDWYSIHYAYDEAGVLLSTYENPEWPGWVEGDPDDLYERDIDYYIENGVRYQSAIQDMHVLFSNVEYAFYVDEEAQSLTLECVFNAGFYKTITYYYDSDYVITGVDVIEGGGDFIVTDKHVLEYNADKSTVTVYREVCSVSTIVDDYHTSYTVEPVVYTIQYDQNGNAESATGTADSGKSVTYTFRWEEISIG